METETFTYKGHTRRKRSNNFDKNVADIEKALKYLNEKQGLTFTAKSLIELVGDKRENSKNLIRNARRVRQQILLLCCDKISTENSVSEYKLSIHGINIPTLAKNIELIQWRIGQKALIDSKIKHGALKDLTNTGTKFTSIIGASDDELAKIIKDRMSFLDIAIQEGNRRKMQSTISYIQGTNELSIEITKRF